MLHGDPVELDENDEDPITYMDAMQRSDSNLWLEAMKSEMESMEVNNVWTLVEPPEGVKLIGCKWIFKRKRSADGKVETYKARRLPRGIVNVMVFTIMRHFLLWQCSSLFGLCLLWQHIWTMKSGKWM